jgi:DNA-binding transcriptional MerR regulator/methanogenic corrinoid protein MtbC1
MHTVSWVAQQLGLAPGTLRAWEQRYGIVRPARSEGGYRLYDDEDVATLREMAALVASGMQPALAAEQLRSGPTAAARSNGSGPLGAGLPDHAVLIASGRDYNVGALEAVLDEAFATASFERVVDGWLLPAMVAVGEAWADGSLDVSQEHFISSGVMRRLAAAFQAAGHPRGGRAVVTGLAPGATHEIATLAFATMLRRAGLRVTHLGADLPVNSWVVAVGATRPDAVVIGVPRAMDGAAAREVLAALADTAPQVVRFLGGPGADAEHALPADSLSEAAAALADALHNASER